MGGPSPAPGFSLPGEAGHASQMACPVPPGVRLTTHQRKDIVPAQEHGHLAAECSIRTVCLSEFIQGGRLSHSGALKPVGSLPCELESEEQCVGLPLPRPTVASVLGTSPAHVVSNRGPNPLFLLGFISRLGVNFLIYYPLRLSFPLFIFILCLEETPATKNQPPEAKAKPDAPSASPLLPGQNSLKETPRFYREDRTQWGKGIFMYRGCL